MTSSKIFINKLKSRYWLYYGILVLSAYFVVMILQMSRQPDMVPLVSDIRLVDVVKIMDVLSSNDIETKAVPKERILWVEAAQKYQAHAILTEAGIDMPLENSKVTNKLANCEVQSTYLYQIELESLVRYLLASVILIVLIVTVVRPLINELVSGKAVIKEPIGPNDKLLSAGGSSDTQPMTRLSAAQFRLAIFSLVGAVLVCIGIVRFAKQPDMRPLINDLTTTNAVLVADVLDQNKVRYYVDYKSHILYVDANGETRARLALARIGVDVDYPSIKETLVTEQAYKAADKNQPVYAKPVFIQLFRLTLAGVFLLVIILSFIKPILNALIRVEDEK